MVLLLFLFRISVCGTCHTDTAGPNIVTVLIIKGTVRHIVRDLAHTFGVDGHGFMRFLGHSEHFAHFMH